MTLKKFIRPGSSHGDNNVMQRSGQGMVPKGAPETCDDGVSHEKGYDHKAWPDYTRGMAVSRNKGGGNS